MTDPTDPLAAAIEAAIWARYSDAEPSATGLVLANPRTVAAAAAHVVRAAAPAGPAPATDRDALSDVERQFLTYALDLAADQMASRGDEFSDEDHSAMDRLRRLAGEAQQDEEPDDTLHACPGRWGGPDCRCFDDEPAREAQQDPAQDGKAACIVAGCGHAETAHNIGGCRDCPRGQRAVHLFTLPAVVRPGQPETD